MFSIFRFENPFFCPDCAILAVVLTFPTRDDVIFYGLFAFDKFDDFKGTCLLSLADYLFEVDLFSVIFCLFYSKNISLSLKVFCFLAID